jgi:hypothetical protein
MSLFKKFTDFCAGIAAFVGGLFLLQQYMVFKPLDNDEYAEWLSYKIKYSNETVSETASETVTEAISEAPSKIKQFFTPELINDFDYRLLFVLVLTLAISVTVGIIFKKLPYVCFFVSLIPALEIAYIFSTGFLYTQIGLFLLLGALHVAGNVFECILKDKEDGRHRLWICAKISTLFPAAICLICTKIADRVPLENIDDKISLYKELAFKMTEPDNMALVTKIGWMYIIIFAITLVLYNVYFIDTILSAIPLVYTVYLLYSGNLSFNPAIFAILAAICFMTHIALCVCENNLSRKEQILSKQDLNDSEEQISKLNETV